jgi:hypothetical protein
MPPAETRPWHGGAQAEKTGGREIGAIRFMFPVVNRRRGLISISHEFTKKSS